MSDAISIGGLEVRYLVDGVETKSTGLFEVTLAPGGRVPPAHSHAENDEVVYVLEGTLRYRVDGETRDLSVGDTMTSPRGSTHSFSNETTERTRALFVQTPDIGRQYFLDVATVLTAGGPPDPAAVAGIMWRYGLTVAKPV